MPELLIKANNAHHRNPMKDRQGCYKRGDPVLVMPDGHPWGREEQLPKFWRVRVPNVQRSLLETHCEGLYEDGLIITLYTTEALPLRQRRRFQLRTELLTNLQRQALFGNWVVELSWTQWVMALIDQREVRTMSGLILMSAV